MIRPIPFPDADWFAATVSCRAACPVGTDAAGYVQAIADGRLDDAYDLARAHNPFPSVCGHVCSAPCERACRRGVIDAPIAIRALKRVICEANGVEQPGAGRWHRAHGDVPPATKPSVGIVGAGPAGLAAAYLLRLAGHAVTLYEAGDEPGGMLLTGIPAFRLPRSLVRQEIAAILALGIDLETRCRIGETHTLAGLMAQHARVLVTAGCAVGRALPVPGASVPGVVRALDFLREFNAGTRTAIAGTVLVVGGGSVAFDAARSAQRLPVQDRAVGGVASGPVVATGAAPFVQLVAPESYEALPVPDEELREAAAEGVVVRAGFGVRQVDAHGSGLHVTVAPVASLYDEQGRFAPALHAGRDEVLDVGLVIVAVGQRADLSFADPALAAAPWGGIAAARDGRTAMPGLLAAGDVSTGPGDLIDAIASGQRAARTIIAELGADDARVVMPESAASAPCMQPLAMERRYWSGYDTIARRELPVLPPAGRTRDREVEGVLSMKDARREASRCLLCDTHIVLDAARCIGCALCVDVCPYRCIALEPDGASRTAFALTLDETSCIRCGLCVDRCPPHALDLVRV